MTEYKAINQDYRAGDDGSVWSNRGHYWKKLKPYGDKDGHMRVSISTRGDVRTKSLPKVILSVFHREPEGTEKATHVDGNRSNNRIENLKWRKKCENKRSN